MMRHPIDTDQHMRAAFERLASMDDITLRSTLSDSLSDSSDLSSVVTAFRALVREYPASSGTSTKTVNRVGIIAAHSVPTAYWPYLIYASLRGVPVKIKIPAENISHLHMLADLLVRGLSTDNYDAFRPRWDISLKSGKELLADGYWDDCERLLVFGSSETVDTFRRHFSQPHRVIGFGHLESILLVDGVSLQADERWVIDLLTFGHIGCLAPRLVVSVDGQKPERIADVMLSTLNGRVCPDLARAITLRNLHNEMRVAGINVWSSNDGMWLISANGNLPSRSIAGHLTIVSAPEILTSDTAIGALSCLPHHRQMLRNFAELSALASWKCAWGMAQFPSMRWINGGCTVPETLSV